MRLLVPALAVAALLTLAPAAAADDATVFNAYVQRQASEVDPAGAAYMRAIKRLGRAKSPRAAVRAFRAVLRANRRINGALSRIELDLEANTASTRQGSRARRQGLMEVRGWQLANRLESRMVRRILAGKRVNVRRALRKPNKIMRRVYGNGRKAVRAFNRVGLSSPVGAVSAK